MESLGLFLLLLLLFFHVDLFIEFEAASHSSVETVSSLELRFAARTHALRPTFVCLLRECVYDRTTVDIGTGWP